VEHDRDIPDSVRVAVLKRDNYGCVWRGCGWNRSMLTRGDPRKFLELHHKVQHKDKGAKTVEKLETLCNVHHDELHSRMKLALG
jgi:5-methylcytosine-specific restriction endonuclease McrA